eukprot:gb/GFBE01028687.1/.p1 GENE.gb/GFBE01028687.1/~~gb/GFBE01028687.1/.p1  ORF type:complete len:302 (+),score=63.67 gb/GFBE01028687.1/:1-906(+)
MAKFFASQGDEKVQSAAVYVKNTFIEVEEGNVEESASGRRASSLPASLRLHRKEHVDLEDTTSDGGHSTEACTEALSEGASSDVGSPASASASSDSAGPADEGSNRGRVALKSSAKAWAPAAQEPEDCFAMEVAQAVAHMQGTLALSGIVTAQVAKGWQGWEIKVGLRSPVPAQQIEALMAMAKQSLLQWAEGSTMTYVMGYCGIPFAQLPGMPGFTVNLGALEDPSCACWDSYRWGFCKRGPVCRWQHPQRVVSCTVRLEMAVAAVLMPAPEGYAQPTEQADRAKPAEQAEQAEQDTEAA